jgi:peptidoglycan/xylan/chitin deacetylase (PgdA/CDA1 family)
MIGTLKGFVRRTGLRRAHVAAARLCCERHALAFKRPRDDRDIGRILCYHSIGQPQWGVNDVSPKLFARHIELALDAGMRFVHASELARTGGGPKDLAITFDDGLRTVMSQAAPILARYGIPWSLYVVSDWAEGTSGWNHDVVLTWREIEQLMKAGAEIGSHSVTHPNFTTLEANMVVDELGESRDMIAKRLGVLPKSFAIPYGQSMNWPALAADAARTAGYDIVYAQAEETRSPGTIPRTFVTRFDSDRIFRALLGGAYDRWEEWV